MARFVKLTLLITHFDTTGLLSNSHEIIEIGAICCDAESLGILWEFQTKVKPRYIETDQPHLLTANGYNKADWADTPSLRKGFGEYYFKLDHTMIFTAWSVLFAYSFYLATITYQRLSDRLDPTPHGSGANIGGRHGKASRLAWVHAASTAFQIAGTVWSLIRKRRSANWFLPMRRSSSMPAIVMAAQS